MVLFVVEVIDHYKLRPLYMKRMFQRAKQIVLSLLKKLVIYGGIVLVIAAGIYLFYFYDNSEVYTKPEKPTEVEVIKEINHLDPLYEKREAELADQYRKIQSIEARIDVNEAEVERLDEQILADRAELSAFITAIGLKN